MGNGRSSTRKGRPCLDDLCVCAFDFFLVGTQYTFAYSQGLPFFYACPEHNSFWIYSEYVRSRTRKGRPCLDDLCVRGCLVFSCRNAVRFRTHRGYHFVVVGPENNSFYFWFRMACL